MGPGPEVLACFGASADPVPLLTTKHDDPAGDGAAGDWVAQDPLGGAWVAWQWLPGEPASWAGVSPSWPGLIAASRAFHQLLAHAHVCRLVTEVVFRRGDPDASAGLETVARTSQPVTVL